MGEYRLLIDVDVIEFLRRRPRGQQELLLARFRAIASDPVGFWDYTEQDSVGRELGIQLWTSTLLSVRACLCASQIIPNFWATNLRE